METRTPASSSTRKPTPAERRRAEKNAREAAARQAAQTELQKRRTRNRVLGFGGVVLLGLVVVGIVALLGGFSGKSATKPSDVSIGVQPSPAWVPDLPKGTDATLKTEPIVTAGTGSVGALKVTTLVQGNGAVVQKGDTITVNYVGVTYADGKEFDSSWGRGQTIQFQIGTGHVIKGWDQGLVGVKVGSRVQLDIPAALAYGTDPSSGPSGDLRFVVDILATAPTPAASGGSVPPNAG